MKHCVSPFAATGISVIDICSLGWTPTVSYVTMLAEKIKSAASKGMKGIVLDLFWNIALRFEQFDGSTALPYKSNGSFHLGWKVVCCNTEQFKKVVVSVSPIFQARGNIPCVVIPPMPRLLFVRCCSDTSHCTNANEQNYKENLLTDNIALRTVLIRQLVSLGCKNFKVLDTCCATGCPATSNTSTRIAELKNVTAGDGVHFSKAGYSNIVHRCTACLSGMNEGQEPRIKTVPHFWRGFKSPKGSSRKIIAARNNLTGGKSSPGPYHWGRGVRASTHTAVSELVLCNIPNKTVFSTSLYMIYVFYCPFSSALKSRTSISGVCCSVFFPCLVSKKEH